MTLSPTELSVLTVWMLNTAARIIETCGWCQHENGSQTGPYCLMDAIRAAAPNSQTGQLVACHVANQIAIQLNHFPLGSWNDHPDRTKTEVIDLLKTCATRYEQAKETV